MIEGSEAPGYLSKVHPGPLKPVLLWKAPHEVVIYNILLSMFICLTLTWRWMGVTVLVHLVLVAFWLYDPHLLPAVIRSLRFPRFLGVS